MAVRLASDTIRTLYAIQCMKKDGKHRSQSPVYKDNAKEIYGDDRNMLSKSSNDSIYSDSSDTSKQKQQGISRDEALVHKVHPSDSPRRNDVKQRTECYELDHILAKWNVYKPKK
ncbi:uncharacterized protein LOC143265133 [Megachile rotundata]|uniref:uncharacterized protein LOC143265133 n=1 Tax=Megachile rotundata TaxID=143995 RepID=UPI003FD11468